MVNMERCEWSVYKVIVGQCESFSFNFPFFFCESAMCACGGQLTDHIDK